MQRRQIAPLAALLLAAVGLTQAATYEVEVTNLTKSQTFTPLLVVSHRPQIQLFETGAPASPELELIAEAGDIAPMEALLGTLPRLVADSNTNGGLLLPGETAQIRLRARGPFNRVSLAGMLIPTNDTFVGLQGAELPTAGSGVFYAAAYDAGTEENDQSCAHMPGPRCGGEGLSAPAPGDEGFVHVGNGFHELGDDDGMGNEILHPQAYDWRNPVARIVVRKLSPGGSDDEQDDEHGD
jgi:hypothetical protein